MNEPAIDLQILEAHPLKQQKIAQKMKLEGREKKIHFTLCTPINVVECVWLDPHLGFFQIVGREDRGFLSVKDLPEGTLIIGQRYEDPIQVVSTE